ncbi:alpha/beta-tubulin-N-acetyltransferase 9 [Leguminivora glycinivorella]|uniref:alpha/beta-tubulin-N-acetyltransferase 9 n=1 Tax=Leguminivora glycinivorella TaxID=1035111 RepID=UPI00200D6260|nr:alpha/beta-tubulin-N-acetyltransferase 9 [Leguminivora glycinivorella]
MKLNSDIKIVGEHVVLVPYREIHVEKYHSWMSTEELQILTASEPLSLEEEYEMQKSWREDADKCTFIILDKAKFDKDGDEISAMIGDTNIFIKGSDASTGEIEIMIAEKTARGKRLGWEAVILMLLYGIKEIKLQHFEAKILMKNSISIEMFQKLGFEETSTSDVFKEVTLGKVVSKEWTEFLHKQYFYQIQPH